MIGRASKWADRIPHTRLPVPALIAQTGSGGVPGIAGADFLSLDSPLISDTGDVVVQGELVTGVGGVTSSNNQGLWRFDGVSSSQIARSGGADVPGISGASFDGFETFAVNSTGQIALKATLQNGGSVDPNNDSGLWLMDLDGQGVLVVREGDSLEGRTISALDFVGGSGGNEGIPAGLNNQGDLVFWAEFTNGDSGLFLFQNLLADFDLDGDVDSNDLSDPTLGWEARYGIDLDGLDFLQWQQELGSGVPLSPTLTTVPEPASVGLLAPLITLAVYCRRRS